MAVANYLHELRGRHILFLNWRDRRHPQAGGAELHCQTIAEGFASAGATVTLFTAAHSGAPSDDEEAGVKILRRGGPLTLYLHAALHLIRHGSEYDGIVDVQNGIPFFAPLFAGRKRAVVGVIHHVHQTQFGMYLPGIQSRIGRLLEGPVSRRVYRRTPIIVVSPSTRKAVRRRLRFVGPLYVVPNGQEPLEPHVGRSTRPTIAYVGRLVAHKRVDLLLRSVAALRPAWDHLDVHICGTGPARSELERLTAELRLSDVVTFHGFVPDAKRNDIISASWLAVNPSVGEGWGLTVLEANSLGVPSIAFNVPGLCDAIIDGTTGWLISEGSDNLEGGIHRALELLSNPDAAFRVAAACRSWATCFSQQRPVEWTARILIDQINKPVDHDERGSGAHDMAVIAEFRSPDSEHTARILSLNLRRTDDWANEGPLFRVFMRGCDELEALSGLGRLDIGSPISVRLATAIDTLLGAEGSREWVYGG